MKKSIETLVALLITMLFIVLCIFQILVAFWGKENSTLTMVSELVTFICIFICIVLIFYVLYKYRKENKKLKRELSRKNREIKRIIRNNQIILEEEDQRMSEARNEQIRLSNDLRKTIAKKQILAEDYKSKLEALTDKYERAQKLHPNLDDEINAMIEEEARQLDMKKAAEVDLLARDAIRVSKNRDIIQKVKFALDEYKRLTERQKFYVQSDISKLERLYKNFLEKQRQEEKK